jgi:hypothetical protein
MGDGNEVQGTWTAWEPQGAWVARWQAKILIMIAGLEPGIDFGNL